jgi:mannose/fructose/N-acetylgalactosamine-specific phosphotransferase system component IIB
MKKYVKWGAFGLLSVALATSMVACDDDDENDKLDNVTPPEVVVETYTVSGVISAISGEAIEGAQVTLAGLNETKTATTNENGVYSFEDVNAGEYTISVVADSKISKSDVLSIVDTDIHALSWNASLASEEAVAVLEVAEDGSAEGEVKAEALEGNDQAEIVVEVAVPAEAIDLDDLFGDDNNSGSTDGDASETREPVQITVTPVYSEDEAESRADSRVWGKTRAAQNRLITGTHLSCNYSNAKIAEGKSIDLTFNVDESTVSAVKAMRYSNGEWVEVENVRMEGSTVVVPATEFTSYALFCPITFTSTTSSRTLSFAQSVWDNLYGSSAVSVASASYTYNVGTEYSKKASNVFEALLLEALARQYGATVATATGNFPMDVTLPVGTKMELSGSQDVNTVTAASGSRSISATSYGDVTVKVTTSNRSHTGGGN